MRVGRRRGLLGWRGKLPISHGPGPDRDPNWDDWDGADWEARFDIFDEDEEYAEPTVFDPLARLALDGDGDPVGDEWDMSPMPERNPMDDSSPRVVYDSDGGSVMLQTNGPAVTVDGIVGEVVFERSTAEGEPALALWLEQAQADVLSKMIRYILEKVPIRPESQQTLRDVLPQVEALLEQHAAG